MRLLLALALAMGCLAAPAAARDNPARDLTRTGIPGAVVLSHDSVHAAGNVHATDRVRVGSVTKTFVAAAVLELGQASCGWFWGHDGIVPGYMAQAYTDGERSAVVLVTGDDRTERQNAAINRAIDQALCS